MHIDVQQIIAFTIVAVAAGAVGRRLIAEVSAIWNSKKTIDCGGCGGCGPKKESTASTPQLVQLQTRPPMRIKPPSTGNGQ